jgi:hypothetical protein
MSLTIQDFLKRGPATVSEIKAATGSSQPTISRYIRESDNIVRLSDERAPTYGATRRAFESDEIFPLCSVDTEGHVTTIGTLLPLAHGGFKIELEVGAPDVLLGSGVCGVFDDLPYFLQDLRPQGFVGRHIAQDLARVNTTFPSNPTKWTASHVGRYLLANGEDLPGNLQLGSAVLTRARQLPNGATPEDYPRLAAAVDRGERPGSSAGGEQAKFTNYNPDRARHVIVKFSPVASQGNTAAERWRDILLTEHIGSQVLLESGLPAAHTEIYEYDGQIFLESDRLDRVNEYGRRPLLSLTCVDEEWVGAGEGWVTVISDLVVQERMNPECLPVVKALSLFGQLIHNNDMHLGNLSVGYEGGAFTLLPVYDMCSMGFRPDNAGVVPAYRPELRAVRNHGLSHGEVDKLEALADQFWERMLERPEASETLRDLCRRKLRSQTILPGL